MENKKIPVFDIGDTLMPCYKMQNQVVKQVVRENGGKPPNFDVNNFRIYNKSHVRKYLDENGIEADAEDIIQTYKDTEEKFLEENGVFQFLKQCSKEFGKIGFISDNSIKGKKWFAELLRSHDVEYEGFIVSEEVGVEKPEPEIFQAFLRERDEKPENFVYFGNNVPRDKAAQDIGMDFVWVKGYETFNTSQDGISISKPSIEEVRKAFEQLQLQKQEL